MLITTHQGLEGDGKDINYVMSKLTICGFRKGPVQAQKIDNGLKFWISKVLYCPCSEITFASELLRS